MKKINEFIVENKGIILTFLVTILVVLLVAYSVFRSFSGNRETQRQTTSAQRTSSSTIDDITTENATTIPMTSDKIDETSHSTEETTTEEVTEETTTKAPVVVDYPYMIKVNRAANCVTVYGKDENGKYTVPVKAITVSCGLVVGDTPLGDYNTINSYNWRLLFGNVYGQYSYRIVGSTLFHSVPYYTKSKDDLEWEEYNKLGSAASAGCVRMPVIDAKWLMDNCPIGTRVVIYDDAANPGPLGKPETIKIPGDSPYRGWDPTDPDKNNPWHKFSATITYPESKVISLDEGSLNEQLLSNFTAKDTCGNDITNKIIIDGKYDLNVPGNYSIKIHVTDAIGKYAEVTISLNVIAKETQTTTENTTPSTSETTTLPTSSDETTTEIMTSDDETSTSTQVESTNNDTNIQGEETTSPMM